jgi:response regulator RpfG family c-di-GMP phosphodiesterase
MKSEITILFVDDEVRIVKLLNMMFRSLYNVMTATSGQEALDIMAEHKIDIIVSDQRMPGMLGIELLSKVREQSPETVRILLTGYADLVAIIGAVNEGEVYRFLNKPWNQEEIKSVIAECAAMRLAARNSAAREDVAASALTAAPLASATKLLMIEGMATDRYEMMEMFTQDYNVISAESIDDAQSILEHHDVGVIVTDASVGGKRTVETLQRLKALNPYVTIVMVSATADADTIIQLINQAHIYRFAMKPISPNIFRLAVSAAMREHHRLLAELPRPAQQQLAANADGEDPIASTIVNSLSRFTEIH